jgi:hypothetical protein
MKSYIIKITVLMMLLFTACATNKPYISPVGFIEDTNKRIAILRNNCEYIPPLSPRPGNVYAQANTKCSITIKNVSNINFYKVEISVNSYSLLDSTSIEYLPANETTTIEGIILGDIRPPYIYKIYYQNMP